MNKQISIACLVLALSWAGPALAKEQKSVVPELEALAHVRTVMPKQGFIDAPFALSDDGTRLLFIEADGGSYATLVVLDIAADKEIARVDLKGITLAPIRVEFAGKDRYLVISRAQPSSKLMANVVGSEKPLSFGPASAIHLTKRGRRHEIVLHDVDEESQASNGLVIHTIERRELRRGKIIGKPRRYESTEYGRIDSIEMQAIYWRDDDLTIVGIHDGGYNKKLDQTMPKYEAWFDVVTGKVKKKIVIDDFIAHREKLETLALHSGENQFAYMARDLLSLRVSRDGVIDVIDLVGSPLHHYDRGSLQYQTLADGSLVFSLTIDPVHPEAAERRRAVPVWKDFYLLPAGSKRAQRVGRIRQTDKRKRSWFAAGNEIVVLPQHVGWRRGGPLLNLYRFSR